MVELDRSIANLWATGRYSDIVVLADEKPEGVTLTFRTESAFFIGPVTVKGVPEPPNPALLVNTTQLNLGEPFDEDQLKPALNRLLDLLKNNGFWNASVRYSIERLAATEEVAIRFVVEPGPRSRFLKPAIEGDPRLPEKKLLDLTGWKVPFRKRGREVSQGRLQRGEERIRDSYLKNDYLSALVSLRKLEYDPPTSNIRPHLEAQAGPRVLVVAEGAKVSGGTMRGLVPVYQEHTVDRELLVEGEQKLAAHFEAEGFFDVKVSFRDTPASENGARRITFTVERGPRYRLAEVAVRGNQFFDESTLKERLEIVPARFPRYPRGVFSNNLLEQGRAAIEALYRTNGFNDVKVTAGVAKGWKGKQTQAAAVYTVEEGEQWFIDEMDLNGVDLKLLDEVRGLISSTTGQPFSLSTVSADRDAVLNWYFNNGYPDAQFDARIQDGSGPRRVRLFYRVTEGRRVFVRDILISGLQTTRRSLVTSRLLFAPQEPLSQSRLVETQRRLYDLGIFAKVDVSVQNPDGRERGKYVLLQVEEARKYSLNLGFGAEFGRIGGGSTSLSSPSGSAAFSPRGLIGITRSNLFGLGHTGSITLRASNIQQRLVLNYMAPQFRGNDKVSLSETTIFDRSTDIRTFTSARAESAIQLSRRLARGFAIQQRVTGRFVYLSEVKLDPALVPVFSQPVKTLAYSTGLILDRRDDPADSTRGVYQTFDFGYAVPYAASSTNFLRFATRNSTYHRVTKELTFARSVSFGSIANLHTDPVPLPERFYGGGASTLRGFPDNQAGPRDLVTGFPIGGQTFFFLNHELRMPLYAKTVTLVLFHDMGNVYENIGKLSFRYHQIDDKDFNYMVQAAGLGFRFKTPVGPIRVDLAFAPNTPHFVGFNGTYDDLIHGRGQYNVPQRVSRFQFHFSIGQAF